jgi:putative nucleotidyltransferase with HDIG domain
MRTMLKKPSRPTVEIRMAEVVSALSYALDITEGQPQGHAARTCLIGMRIADEIGLRPEMNSALFYGLLLKDIGCSSNAAKMCYLIGNDDRKAKCELKTYDWTRFGDSLKYAFKTVAPAAPFLQRMGMIARLAIRGQRGAKELVQIRCERGASIAAHIGLSDETANAIRALDEHWDGHGHPLGLRGTQIPLLGRILGLAQTVEVFNNKHGLNAAFEVAKQRSGTWFDPELVQIFLSLRSDDSFWQKLASADPATLVTELEPRNCIVTADDNRLDRIAEGFSEVIDAKSPWTFRHSRGVAEISSGIARILGFSHPELSMLNRAALLHDVGKLGVSNTILDKPGKLTHEEMEIVKRHPHHTYEILRRVKGFSVFADLAASHHERIDGKGYHRGLPGEHLTTAVRILAVADIYEALASKRPYRKDLGGEEVMTIMNKMSGSGICPHIFSALKAYLAKDGFVPVKLAA